MRDLELHRVRDGALAGAVSRKVRAPIRASWSRARQLGLRADAYLPPVPMGGGDLERERERHPLAAVWPSLLDSLRGITTEPGNLLFLSDANGYLLWVRGDAETLGKAERVHLVPGALWSEQTAGTSGVGTALTLRRPFQVFGAEHFLSAVTGYTCTAAPIHDPGTGELLGAIDLTCATRERSPHLMTLLATTARLAESQLLAVRLREHARARERYADRLARRGGVRAALIDAAGVVVQSSPPGWLGRCVSPVRDGEQVLGGEPVVVERLAPGGPFLVVTRAAGAEVVRLEALGRHRARLHIDGSVHELSPRHSEIVVILLANPGGVRADELAGQVYGSGAKTVTLRAELVRLRSVLGSRLRSEPYRLAGECTGDFVDVEANLPNRAAGELLDSYPGPLLPGSAAPGVRAIRDRLHERLRSRVLGSADQDAVTRWSSAYPRD